MNSTQPLNDLGWLNDLIQNRTGLRVSDTQANNVANIVAEALASLPLGKDDELLSILVREPIDHPLWRKLIHTVTVGETYFFRNQHQFNVLRTDVLRPLIDKRRKAGNKQLRLWSAGCATGEEPYSLAILLHELLPDFGDWHITLLATDINLASLERARQGVYRAWSFRDETPAYIRDRWFTPAAQGYQLASSIRNSVIFQPLNLVSDDYPSYANGTMAMDLIMCRNVTIYFDQTTTRDIAARFCRALNDEGWLIVGHAEPMASVYDGLTPRNFPNTVVYQKVITDSTSTSPTLIEVKPATAPLPALSRSLPLVTVKYEIHPPTETHLRRTAKTIEATQNAKDATVISSWQRAKQAADLEQWQAALIWLAQAEGEDKFQPQVYHLRALVQLHIGDVEGAMESLRQAIYCDASFALAHYALGELYESSGTYTLAARHWRLTQTALASMNPDEYLPFADDMTVNMLQGLLAHRLNTLATKG